MKFDTAKYLLRDNHEQYTLILTALCYITLLNPTYADQLEITNNTAYEVLFDHEVHPADSFLVPVKGNHTIQDIHRNLSRTYRAWIRCPSFKGMLGNYNMMVGSVKVSAHYRYVPAYFAPEMTDTTPDNMSSCILLSGRKVSGHHTHHLSKQTLTFNDPQEWCMPCRITSNDA